MYKFIFSQKTKIQYVDILLIDVTWNPLESGRFLGVSEGDTWVLRPDTQHPILPHPLKVVYREVCY